MSALEVTFPNEWRTMPMCAGGGVTTLLPTPDELRFDDRASMALLDECCGVRVQVFCAIGVVPGPAGHDELRAVAEGGRHSGLVWDTVVVPLSMGRALRSTAFRFDPDMLADESLAPYTAEVRYALPLPGERIAVLHFETYSLTCFEELESRFDLIAGTARIA